MDYSCRQNIKRCVVGNVTDLSLGSCPSYIISFVAIYTASKTGKAPESLEICALCHLVQPILPWVRELVPQFFQQNMTDSNKPSKRPKNASSIARWSHEWQVIFDWQVLTSKRDFTHYFGDFKVSVYPK